MGALVKYVRKQLRPVRRIWETLKGCAALFLLKQHLNKKQTQQPHNLPGTLIISLTSYPPRYQTLKPTLQCLLSQNIKPDHVILWIAHSDMAALPEDILALRSDGLEIRPTDDMKVYNKIIPALMTFPESFIVTADDDTYYGPTWLENLLKGWEGDNKQIVCHRAYLIMTDQNNIPLPYNDWKWDIKGPRTGKNIFPLGVGGVLYPPGALPLPETLDHKVFLELAPKADDLWLYWMGRKNGVIYKKTGYNRQHCVWPISQNITLGEENTGKFSQESAYEYKIKNLIKSYGFP